MSDAKDVSDRHLEDRLPHDPQKEAKPANNAAAKVVALRRELVAVTLADGFARVVKEAESGATAMGLTTGHFKLDARICGLRPKHVTTLGGRTSFGKTSKALQIADLALAKIDQKDDEILFFSSEDGETMCLKRLMARRANVNALRLRANRCTPRELDSMRAVAARAERTPFFVDAVGASIEDVTAFIRERGKKKRVRLVVFDYLQKAKCKKRFSERRLEVGYVADELGMAIKEVNAAGLLLSQVSRPDKNKPDAEPTMYDLKEAGEIENASEHVIIGHVRKDPIQGAKSELRVRQIRIWKNKDGPVFDEVIDQAFDEYNASFKETSGEVLDDGIDDVHNSFDDGEARHP